MKLDASDAANVRGRAESYKLDDIMAALKKMWSGGGLCAKDLERKKRKDGQTYVAHQTSEPSIYHETEETYEKESVTEELEEQAILEDATAWYQEALDALLEEPEDSTILATFKEARKALDAARTARGFYPVRNPNARREGSKGFGKKGYSGKGGDNPHADKQCLRCGKRGHIARNGPQRPQQGRGSAEGNGGIGFVGWNEEADQGQQGSECIKCLRCRSILMQFWILEPVTTLLVLKPFKTGQNSWNFWVLLRLMRSMWIGNSTRGSPLATMPVQQLSEKPM